MLYSMSWSTIHTPFRYTLASREVTLFSILTVGVTLTFLCMKTINDISLSITIYMKYLVNSTINGRIPAAAKVILGLSHDLTVLFHFS